MADYGYIDKAGAQQTLQANDTASALAMLSTLPNADPRSGVIAPPIASGPAPSSAASTGGTTNPPPTTPTISRRDMQNPARGSVEEIGALLAKTPTAPRTREQIFNEKLSQSQGLIDSVNQMFAPIVQQEKDAGAARDARTRAINIASGLGGSDFASAAAIETEKVTQKNLESIEAQKQARIAQILYGVQTRADEEFQADRDRYGKDLETAYNARMKFREQAIDDVKALGGMGLDAAGLKTKDPNLYQQLLDQTGYSELELDSQLIAANPKIDISKVKTEKFGNTLLMTYVDPKTGQITQQKYDVGDTGYDGFTIAPDGTPLFYNKSTATVKAGAGNFRKPLRGGGTGGVTTGGTQKEAIAEMAAYIKTQTGRATGVAQDDYVSPSTYNSLKDEWQAAGFSAASFDSNFNRYINPKTQGYNATNKSVKK